MSLVSFSGEVVQLIGQITLPTTLGTGSPARTVNLTYLVVGARSVHNVILGRPGMCAFGIISSTIHGSLKFPTEACIATLHSESTICVAEIRQSEGNGAQPPALLTEEWAIHPDFPEQKIVIGAQLPERTKRLRSINLKLNPKKCSFGLEEGKFYGVWITQSGIQAHPDKVQAVVSMQPPKTVKEIQSLNGKLVVLHHFISKAADRTIPFMNVLKKSTGETVTVYLSASHFAISAVLVVHRNQAQIPVYYVSRVLKDYETRYPIIEKLALVLVHASRRLRRYFQAFNIEVQTNLQIQQIIRKPEVSGRLTKWAIELSAFDITYRTRGPVKGQVVADFLTEVFAEESTKEKPVLSKVWNLYTDGASSKEEAGVGLILIDPEGIEYTYALRFEFKTSNNETEYEALLAGLQTAAKAGASSVLAHVDSLLVANQVNGEYEAREENMIRYLNQVNSLMATFDSCKIVHIPRSKNKKADALSKLASVTFCHSSKEVLVETLQALAISLGEAVMSITVQEKSWITPIFDYLENGKLPEDKAHARKIKVKALHYQVHDGKLYRKTFLGPLLRCLTL
ncbi:uncharacterized protein LOC110900563 [Helianthus annuus]|uniref:uncharacterized protein LOC110900563 n=1 Tax=Helianthus annuus TaxID=4232 RepID=UPI000B90724B|nr:uncharacterized protein LOC110900563 [Helianthus annuus]